MLVDDQRLKGMTDDGGAETVVPENLRRQAVKRLHLSRADVSKNKACAISNGILY
jgi:hypothetical protein